MVVIKVNYTNYAPVIKVNYDDSPVYLSTSVDATYIKVDYGGSGGNSNAIWGLISGTLSDQLDLQAALDAKFDDPTGTTSQYVRGDGSIANFPNIPQGTVTSVGLSMPSGFVVTNSPVTSSGTLTVSGGGSTSQYLDGTGALQTFPITLPVLQEVRNQSGATITAGTVVYINGATGNKPTIAKAIATGDSTSAQTLGMVSADISNNGTGYVVVIGTCSNLNTSAYTEGQQLYLSGTVAGGVTTTKPYAPTHLVYIGIVTRQHPSLGTIEVRVQNGYELEELHNVSAQNPNNNDGIFYNSSTSLWEHKQISTVLGYTPEQPLTFTSPLVRSTNTISIPLATGTVSGYLSSTDWTTFNNKQNALTNPVTGTGANNQVAFFNGTTSITSESNLYWDATNNKLGIQNSNPNALNSNGSDLVIGDGSAANRGLTIFTGNSNAASIFFADNGSSYAGGIQYDHSDNSFTFAFNGVSNTALKYASGVGLTIGQMAQSSIDTDKFLVWDNGVVKYRSGSEILSDIGGQAALTLTTTGSSGASTLVGATLNIPTYTISGLGGVPTSRSLTINGTAYDLSADRSWSVGTITSLTGEATASGSGAVAVTLTNSAVIGKVLTGLNLTGGGTIASTDTILEAFGKVQNQISGLVGGVMYQGTWNASTNTPTLTSSVGTKGYYYIVSTAGSTNLNGVTDWKIGDWAIFNGSTWDKVDNTDAVSSVNGYTGAVSLSTSDIGEGTNLYFTNTRAQNAITLTTSGTSGSATYSGGTLNIPSYSLSGLGGVPTSRTITINGTAYDLSADRSWSVGTVTSVAALTIGTSGTDVSSTVANGTTTPVITLSIPTASASNRGALSSTDWSTFNAKQNAITLTTTGSSGSSTLVGSTLNIPTYTLSGLGGVPYTGATGNVNLGAYSLGSASINILGNGSTTGGSIGFTQYSSASTGSPGVTTISAFTSLLMSLSFSQSGGAYKTVYFDASEITDNTVRTLTFPNASGTLALTSNLSSYVPYTGATTNLDLGTNSYSGANITLVGNNSSQAGSLAFKQFSSLATDVAGSTTFGAIGTSMLMYGFSQGSGNFKRVELDFFYLTNNVTRRYTYPNASGTLALTSDLTGGTVTSIALATGTSGSDINVSGSPITSSGTITLNIPTASASARGLLSSTDWSTFNNKQNALTNPVTGTGTTNYVPKFTGASAIGNSQIYDNGTNVGIGTTSPNYLLHLQTTSTYLTHNLKVDAAAAANNYAEIAFQLWAGAGSGENVFGGSGTSRPSAVIRALSEDNAAMGSLVFATFSGGATNATLTEKMRINSSGNVGIGVTPSAWGSNFKAIQAGGVTALWDVSGVTGFSNNLYNDGTSNYLTNNYATIFQHWNGQFAWLTAPSGTAGNAISFTQAMTLDASGNLGIGMTSPTIASGYRSVIINGTTGSIYRTQVNGTTAFDIQSDTITYLWENRNTAIAIGTNASERLRITSGGNLLVGTTTDNGAKLQVSGSASFTTTSQTTLTIASTETSGRSWTFNTAGTTYGSGAGSFVLKNNGIDALVLNSSSEAIFYGNGIFTTTSQTTLTLASTETSGRSWTFNTAGTTYGSGLGSFVLRNNGIDALVLNSSNAATFSSSVTAGADITIQKSAGSSPNLILFEGGAESRINATRNSDTNSDLRFQTEISGTVATRMIIDYSGNVGIGTTSPSYTFHTVSADATIGAFRNSGAAIGQLIVGNTVSDLVVRTLASGDGLIYSDTGKYLAFGSNGATERFRITSGGNLLVGTTTDSGYKLDVNGNARIVGNEYIAQVGGVGTFKQTVVGQTTAASSGTAKKIAYVGFTHSVRVYVWANQSSSSGSSAIADICTVYGSSSGGTTVESNFGNVTDIIVAYNNGGSPNYTIDVTVTYTGSAPTINYVIEGISWDNNIYTI